LPPDFSEALALRPFQCAMSDHPSVAVNGYHGNQFAALILLKKPLGVVGFFMKITWTIDAQDQLRHPLRINSGEPPNDVVVGCRHYAVISTPLAKRRGQTHRLISPVNYLNLV